MGARCFGEFVGTAVLILLGDGVVANVLLKRSKAEGAGWLAIAAGLGIRRGVWRVHRNRLRQSGWLYQPGIHARHGDLVGRFFEVLAVSGGTGVGCDRGRGPGLGAIIASLASDRRCVGKAPLLLDDARYPQFGS
jgi:hypothetical protein